MSIPDETTQGFEPADRDETPEQIARRLRVRLRQAIWDASQVMGEDKMRTFFELVLDEIASDEP